LAIIYYFFSLRATAPTTIYTLSLHDALPIYRRVRQRRAPPLQPRAGSGHAPRARRALRAQRRAAARRHRPDAGVVGRARQAQGRSEEHTSELQSRENLVCRLLLEKKKHKTTT